MHRRTYDIMILKKKELVKYRQILIKYADFQLKLLISKCMNIKMYEMHYNNKRNQKLITIIFTRQSAGFDKSWGKWISEAIISFVLFQIFLTQERGLTPTRLFHYSSFMHTLPRISGLAH